jgi:hypothetical protein
VSQLHRIDCDQCCNEGSMSRTSGGMIILPSGWYTRDGHDFCSFACVEDYGAGVEQPSTPRYNQMDRHARAMLDWWRE